MKARSVVLSLIAMSGLIMIPSAFAAQPGATLGNTENGKKLFNDFGCYACHGMQAQGALLTGPRLAATVWSPEAMAAYMRAPSGGMPPYTAKVISDAQIADIHAWLITLPKPADPREIPLLR